jgi:DNA-binding HxlR family transcriptional regulator
MDSYRLEILCKGVANHYRIRVLEEVHKQPDLSVEELADRVRIGYKTLSVHLKKMESAGLLTKKQYGRRVEHSATALGEQVAEFLRGLS